MRVFPRFYLFKRLYLLFDKIASFLLISSIYIAIIGVLEAFVPFLLYQIKVNFSLLLAAFFLTFSVYNLNKLSDIKEDSINLPERAGFIGRNKKPIIYTTLQ
jgi:4-hydroxybenzoate polyprenyltransferase